MTNLVNRASEIAFIGGKFDNSKQDEIVEPEVINIAQFNIENLFEEKVYKNGNRKISIRPLDGKELKQLCVILSIFKYRYNYEYLYFIVENGKLKQLKKQHIKERLLSFIQTEIYDSALSNEYRNVFIRARHSLISASFVEFYCPLINSSNELDHEVAMCIDNRYRNNYYKDCLIDYLKHNNFSFIHPKDSNFGYYYKKISANEYAVVYIVQFDEIKAQYTFDLLVVRCENNEKYPIIGKHDEQPKKVDFNIFQDRACFEDLLSKQ